MRFKSPLPFVTTTILLFLSFKPAPAEDWGVYRIVSASTPEFVLEAIGGVKEGAVVSIQKPSDSANQKWIVVPADGAVKVAAAADPSLVLAAKDDVTTTPPIATIRTTFFNKLFVLSFISFESSQQCIVL